MSVNRVWKVHGTLNVTVLVPVLVNDPDTVSHDADSLIVHVQ